MLCNKPLPQQMRDPGNDIGSCLAFLTSPAGYSFQHFPVVIFQQINSTILNQEMLQSHKIESLKMPNH